MPFINIRIVREVIANDPVAIKAQISAAVASAVSDAASIPPENVWVVFEEVSEADWFVGAHRVKELRAGA